MLIELGDDNTVRVTHHGLVDATQGYEIDAHHTPTFRCALFPVNQLDTAGSTATLGGGKCSISSPQSQTTITGHYVNDFYFISANVASAHPESTVDGLPITPQITASSTVPRQSLNTLAIPRISMPTRMRKTCSILTNESTSLSPTTPPSAPMKLPQGTPAISSPNAPRSAPISTSPSPPIAATKSKSTRKTLTILQSRLWHQRFAHMQPASVQ